jgi:hypothetical protein
MFEQDIKQVFDAKTGKYIGYIIQGKQFVNDEEQEAEPETPTADPNQLTLF